MSESQRSNEIHIGDKMVISVPFIVALMVDGGMSNQCEVKNIITEPDGTKSVLIENEAESTYRGLTVQEVLDRLRRHVIDKPGETMWLKDIILDIEIDCRRKGVPFR